MSSSLSESSKLARCSERAALVYCLTLPQHDGEGRLRVDDVSLIDMLGRFAIVHRWTTEDMPAVREEIAAAGLWRLYVATGEDCAEVVGWEKHQRLDRIKRGSDLLVEAVEHGGTEGGLRGERGGSKESQRGEKRAIEDKGTEDKKREENRARARISEDRAKDSGIPPPSGAALQEWAMMRLQVIADFRAALGREEWAPSRIDESAAREAASLLTGLRNRVAAFRSALEVLAADGRSHPHKLADAIQTIRNGDHERKTRPGAEPTGPRYDDRPPWEIIGLTRAEYESVNGGTR